RARAGSPGRTAPGSPRPRTRRRGRGRGRGDGRTGSRSRTPAAASPARPSRAPPRRGSRTAASRCGTRVASNVPNRQQVLQILSAGRRIAAVIGYASRPASADDEMDAASAGRLAAAVGRREVSAAELAAAATERAQTRGAELNAVAVPLYADAAAAAARIDARPAGRPLEGVPVSVKETLWVRDTPCSAGVPRLAG